MNADQPTPDLVDGHSTAWANFVNGIDVDLLQLERCVSSAESVEAAAALVAGERPNAPQQKLLEHDRANGGVVRMTAQERVDEALWLLNGGMHPALIVGALGVRANTLEIAFHRVGRSDLASMFSAESKRERLRRKALAA